MIYTAKIILNAGACNHGKWVKFRGLYYKRYALTTDDRLCKQ